MYGAMSKVKFGAHGYAANFILSVFDRDFKDGLDVAGCVKVIKNCIHELKTRFLINQPEFMIKVVDKDGIRVLSLQDFE
jgi:20S proteasome alpha/beta subunit